MKIGKTLATIAVAALAINLSACGAGAAPSAQTGSQPVAQPTSGGGSGSAPTSAPTSVSASAPTATAAPTTAPTRVPTAAPSPTAAASSIADLMAKSKALGDYTYDLKIEVSGMTMTGKAFAKGSKMRQEMSVSGMNTVTLIDSTTKVAYTLMPDQKLAMKVDFSKIQGSSSPTDQVTGMPASAKAAGSDTVDGKSTTVYEYTQDSSTGKLWIWTEKAVPLKAEFSAAGSKAVMTFSNYQFGALDPGLFEVPSGYRTIDMPAVPIGGAPAGSVQMPVPGTKP